MLGKAEKAFEKYESCKREVEEVESMSIKVVGGITDILKLLDFEIINGLANRLIR